MLGISSGNAITGRLVGKMAIETVLVRGNALSLASGALFLLATLTGTLNLMVTGILAFLFTLGVGLCGPGGVAKAISVRPELTGTASGLYGFSQMLIGALCTALVGLGSSPAMAAALVMVAAGIIAQVSLRM